MDEVELARAQVELRCTKIYCEEHADHALFEGGLPTFCREHFARLLASYPADQIAAIPLMWPNPYGSASTMTIVSQASKRIE